MQKLVRTTTLPRWPSASVASERAWRIDLYMYCIETKVSIGIGIDTRAMRSMLYSCRFSFGRPANDSQMTSSQFSSKSVQVKSIALSIWLRWTCNLTLFFHKYQLVIEGSLCCIVDIKFILRYIVSSFLFSSIECSKGNNFIFIILCIKLFCIAVS